MEFLFALNYSIAFYMPYHNSKSYISDGGHFFFRLKIPIARVGLFVNFALASRVIDRTNILTQTHTGFIN